MYKILNKIIHFVQKLIHFKINFFIAFQTVFYSYYQKEKKKPFKFQILNSKMYLREWLSQDKHFSFFTTKNYNYYEIVWLHTQYFAETLININRDIIYNFKHNILHNLHKYILKAI